MHHDLVAALRRQRATICQRWRVLLQRAPASSPLGRPDTLVYLVDWSVDQVFATLSRSRRPGAGRDWTKPELRHAGCACGRNPLMGYFLAGEQAFIESLLPLLPAATEARVPRADVAATEIHLVLRRHAREEIALFCSVCQHRPGSAPVLTPTSARATARGRPTAPLPPRVEIPG